jgi:hypothetical protein
LVACVVSVALEAAAPDALIPATASPNPNAKKQDNFIPQRPFDSQHPCSASKLA